MSGTQDREPGRTILCPRCKEDTFHAVLRDTPTMKVYICDKCKYRRVFRRDGEDPTSAVLTDKMTLKEARIRRAIDELMTEAVNHFFQNPEAFVEAIPLLESAMAGGPPGPALSAISKEVVYRFAWLTALQVWMQGLDRWRFVHKHMDDKDKE